MEDLVCPGRHSVKAKIDSKLPADTPPRKLVSRAQAREATLKSTASKGCPKTCLRFEL